MNASLFSRLLGSMRMGTLLLFLLGMLLLAVALVSGVFSLLSWEPSDRGPAAQVALALDPLVQEAQLDRLYLEVRQWQEVASLRLALEAQDLGLPASVPLPPNAPAILLNLGSDANPQQVVDRAQMLGGVQQALPLVVADNPAAQQQAQVVKPLLLSAFVVFTLASFIALHGGVRRLLRQWKGELELLRLSGVSRRDVASSFAAVTLLFSAVGAALAAAGIYLGLPWVRGNVERLQPYLPSALGPQRVLGLALGALIVGLLVGVLASAWGTRARGGSKT